MAKTPKEKKSIAAAVILGLFLGPLGTFYSGWKVFLVFVVLFIGGIIGISAITGTAYNETMSEIETEYLDEYERSGVEAGAAIGTGLGFLVLFFLYLAVLGLAAIITNVMSCQRHNNRVEAFLRDEAERRHQEILSKT